MAFETLIQHGLWRFLTIPDRARLQQVESYFRHRMIPSFEKNVLQKMLQNEVKEDCNVYWTIENIKKLLDEHFHHPRTTNLAVQTKFHISAISFALETNNVKLAERLVIRGTPLRVQELKYTLYCYFHCVTCQKQNHTEDRSFLRKIIHSFYRRGYPVSIFHSQVLTRFILQLSKLRWSHQEFIHQLEIIQRAIRFLLHCGASIDGCQGYYTNPLRAIIVDLNYSSELLELIMENGADPFFEVEEMFLYLPPIFENNRLFDLVFNRQVTITQFYIISKYRDLRYIGKNGHSLLHVAVYTYQPHLIWFFLKNGFDFRIPFNYQKYGFPVQSIMDYSMQSEYFDVALQLMVFGEVFDVNTYDKVYKNQSEDQIIHNGISYLRLRSCLCSLDAKKSAEENLIYIEN